MNADSPSGPSERMLWPLLEGLQENGPLRARDAYQIVAEKLKVSDAVRQRQSVWGAGHVYNAFERDVRWTKQNAILAGLMLNTKRGVWELADPGKKGLFLAKPGVAICVARDSEGAVLWAQAQTAMGYVEPGTCSLIFTSMPYPLVENRDYAGTEWEPNRYLDTVLRHVDLMIPLLRKNGSMVLNFGDVYQKGRPVLNMYQERLAIAMEGLGLSLCGRSYCSSPGKPRTTTYVTRTRERLASGVEYFWWWSPSDRPYANNRAILEPYSEIHKAKLATGGWDRKFPNDGFRQSSAGMRYRTDNGGKIPFNFTSQTSEGSNCAYLRYCREAGIRFNAARMPIGIAEQWIRFTTLPGALVFDPFSGSLVTHLAARRCGRRVVSSEHVLQFLQGGVKGRLMPDFPMEACFDLLTG